MLGRLFSKNRMRVNVFAKFAAAAVAISAVSASGFCAEVREIISSDFENPDNFEFVEMTRTLAKVEETEKPDEVVAGKRSLVLDNMDTKARYPYLVRFKEDAFKSGKAYVVSFDFKVLALGKGKRNHVYFMQDKGAGGDGKHKGYCEFGTYVGETGHVETFYAIPAGVKAPTHLAFTSYFGSRVAIDNFRIVETECPPEWFGDKSLFFGVKNNMLERGFTNPLDPIFSIPRDKFFPFVDEFGQFKHRDWHNKIKRVEDFKERLAEEKAFNAALKPIKNRDKFGGLIDENYKFPATPNFTVRKVGGKWFFVTPEGNLFWSLGCNAVGEQMYTPYDQREFYFENVDPKCVVGGKHLSKSYGKVGEKCRYYITTRKTTFIKYGNGFKYAEHCLDRMRVWGLNTVGAWSPQSTRDARKVPYLFQFTSPRDVLIEGASKAVKIHWSNFPDPFYAQMQPKIEEHLRRNIDEVKSPYCLGVLIDNELSWQMKDGLMSESILSCKPDQPAKIAMRDFFKKRYSDIGKLSAAWGIGYKSWDDFLANTDYKTSESPAYWSDLTDFDRVFAETYFTKCRNAVKNVAPDSLYISCRFAWRTNLPVSVAEKICDVVAMNLYGAIPSQLAKLPDGFSKPVMIGEFTFARIDKGNFGVYGGTCACRSSKERVEKYRRYINDAVNNPNFVGAHWFTWRDQPVTGRCDGEHFAFGLVDICDTPDFDLLKAVHKVSQKMYRQRLGSGRKN